MVDRHRNRIGARLVALVAIFAGLFLWPASMQAAPSPELWERWTANDPASTASVDHTAWDTLLKRYVSNTADGATRVSYSTFTVADLGVLLDYVASLENVPVSTLNRDEQFAYWVNLYNAVTVALIVKVYPVRSIRDIDISPGFFSDGPWGKKLVTVEGEKLSLDDIEHRVLRPIWRDPRIHYAVSCAAIGCPDLMPRAVTASNAEAYLEEAARAYVNDPRGVTIADGKLEVSSIYVWYQADFGGNDAGVIEHLKKYASTDLAKSLDTVQKIDDDDYDWKLNSVVLPPVTPLKSFSMVGS